MIIGSRFGRSNGVGNGAGAWLGGAFMAGALVLAAAPLAHAAPPANQPQAQAHGTGVPALAKVGDVVITQQEFETAFVQAARSKFYHGKPPEGAVASLQREVAQSMIDEVLVAYEARRRKIQPDHAAIKKTLDRYDAQYKNSEQWKSNRARLLPALKDKLERDSIVEVLTKQVRTPGEPTPKQLEQYYEANKDKFTSPEQVHVSMILLKVDPSSPQAKWDATKEEGASIVKRLKAGADFKQLAELHSGDESGKRGGDLGYVHRGMLPEAAQEAVDKLKPGETTDVVALLEGIGVFRLHERKAPKLNPLPSVRERAIDLWKRDAGEQAWTAFLTKLRRETPTQIDESRFLPLPVAAGKPASSAATR